MILPALILSVALGAAPPTSAPDSATPVYEIALYDAQPDRTAAAADLLARYAGALHDAPGCLRVELLRQPAPTSNHFALLTVWQDTTRRDRNDSSPPALAFRASFQPLAASPVDERDYAKAAP